MNTARNLLACFRRGRCSRTQNKANATGCQLLRPPRRNVTGSARGRVFRYPAFLPVLAAMSDMNLSLRPFVRRPRLLTVALFTLLIVSVAIPERAAFGQPVYYNGGEVQSSPDQSASYSIGAPGPDYFSLNQPETPSVGDGGMGWLARLNYQAGKTVGTEESLLNFHAMPYVFSENTMLLGDLSIYRLNSGRMGGFAGAGVRHYFPGINRTLGFISSYGIDGAYKESFDNITLGIESRGQYLDWLTNIYLPIGDREREVGLDFASGSQEFIGNNIEFDQVRTTGYNLSGFDMMFGTPLPSEFAQKFDMRAYAGFYGFNHPDIDDIWGWSMKLEANTLKYLDLNLNLTHDDTFDTRVSFNATWTLDPRREYGAPRTVWDRMMLPPSRLYTVPKAEVKTVEQDILAINPETGAPYIVVHVDSVTGVDAPGAGTVETPFDSIDNALNGGNAVAIDDYDIVFVRSGSSYDSEPTIIVPEGKRFLGEGDRVEHYITYNEFGSQIMPRARGTYDDGIFDARPLYTNLGVPGGPGVTFDTLTNLGGTVQSNAITEFSGFVIGNPDGTDITSGDSTTDINPNNPGTPGNGAAGNGIEYVTLGTDATVTRFVDLNGAQGDGLVFDTVTGTYQLDSVIVNQSATNEIRVDGGAPDITFNSATRGDNGATVDTTIINRDNGSANAPDGIGGAGDNHDLLVRGTTGGSVFLNDAVINDIGGDGILFTGSASDASIPVSTYIEDSRAQGIFVAPGTSGTITLSATRTDGNPSGQPMTIVSPNNNAIQIGLPTEPFNALFVTPADVRVLQAVSIQELDRDYSGLMVADTSGDTIFFSEADLNMGYTTGTGTASGIEFFQNSTGNLTFNGSVGINNSGGSGIRVSNNTVNTAGSDQARLRFLGADQVVQIFNSNVNEATPGSEGAAVVIGNDSPAGFPSNSVTGSPYENLVQFTSQLLINNGNGIGVFSSGNTGNINFGNQVNINSNLNEVSLVYLEDNVGDITFASLVIDAGTNIDTQFASPNDPTALELANFHAAVDLRNNSGALRFNDIDIEGDTTGFFGVNNSLITISGGSIDVNDATALEILTTDTAVAAGADLTDVSIIIDEGLNSDDAPDHGVHLANVKGNATFTNGDISDAGLNVFTNDHAGMYFDNSAVRDREDADGFDFFSSDPLTVSVNAVDFTNNSKGIRAIDIDELDVEDSLFQTSDGEAIDAENVVQAEITTSTFNNNQNFGFNEQATVRTRYTRTLNTEDQADGNPQFYDFVVGLRSPDFLDFNDDNIPNIFQETFASYSILMVNDAEDNQIGILDAGTTGAEFGYIVNNNQFDRNVSLSPFQSFVYYIDNENSRINMNVAMNDMTADGNNTFGAPVLRGAIGFEHNSDRNVLDDDIVFTAIDNRMRLSEQLSTAYNFVTSGEGTATIIVDDTPDDVLTELGDPLNDLPLIFNPATFAQTDFNPDISVAGTAFRFDLGTDANIDITNTEIYIEEDTDGLLDADTAVVVDQRGFLFENVEGDNTNINISNNTLLFEDFNATGAGIIPKIDPFTGVINEVENDLLVTEFNVVTGGATLQSSSLNNVLYFDGTTSAFLTNPDFLFDATSINNIDGQLNFNGVFVP